MNLPQIPLFVFIALALLFVYIILCTDLRHSLLNSHISNSVVFVGVVIGFILLYSMQKYDRVDENSLLVARHLNYLALMANQYDPDLIKYLIQYSQDFLCNKNTYAILCFERKLVPHLKKVVDKKRVRHIVSILDNIFDERVSESNVIPNLIWYVVLATIIILTVLFPLDNKFDKRIDSLLVIILLWLPVTVIYYLYQKQTESIVDNIENIIDRLKDMYKHPDKYTDVNGYCSCIVRH